MSSVAIGIIIPMIALAFFFCGYRLIPERWRTVAVAWINEKKYLFGFLVSSALIIGIIILGAG